MNSLKRLISIFIFTVLSNLGFSQVPQFNYTITINTPQLNEYDIELIIYNCNEDTLLLQLPQWHPGYYQIMDYYKDLNNFKAHTTNNQELKVLHKTNSWKVINHKHKDIRINYTIKTHRQFVANSYVDETHAYIIPTNTFLFNEQLINTPVNVKIQKPENWSDIATGLKAVSQNKYTASNFDILFDSPILIGKLEELPPFYIKGVKHKFVGYQLGEFNKELFMQKLESAVKSATKLMDDIPYEEYTFIAIGQGMGGIEHLNNTTISFDGNQLTDDQSMTGMMNFLTHEYFHNFNVKRIRPVELGPFDYNNGNRTNLLWISEGLTVYYEYLIMRRAGLSDLQTLLSSFEAHINHVQNNPGRLYQSLYESSYATWNEGPFGNQSGKSISYYQKGPIVGLLLDFEIRNASDNKNSLDTVMKAVYQKYYKELNRGFTNAEFQQICEQVAGKSLSEFFKYIFTTEELDYNKYLSFSGLELIKTTLKSGKTKYKIAQLENITEKQKMIFNDWAYLYK